MTILLLMEIPDPVQLRRRRVLLCEDEEHLCRIIKRALSPSVDIDAVTSGQAAIEQAERVSYDAAAIDINLPDRSGLQVIQAVRERQPAAGIVAITGFVDVDVAVASMKAGADDFLAKPFDYAILLHMLERAMDGRSQRLAASEAAAFRALAYTDALTGCRNRRFLDEMLEAAVIAAHDREQPLTVAYFDVDNFKLLNDYQGHHEGDRILQRIADTLRTHLKPPAVFARYGGDEFVAVFPGKSLSQADVMLTPARRLASTIEAVTGANVPLPVRMSIGLAQIQPGEQPRDLIARAENAMYLDKAIAPALLAGGIDVAINELTIESVANLKALRGLVLAIDRRDAYTRFHSDHATNLSLRVAARLGFSQAERNAIVLGGPVHDLGKIAVPDDILRKPGPLTSEERRTMEQHPVMGAAITAAVMDQDAVVDLVRHHHERFDGNGYPGGLTAHGIRLTTRLFSISDAYSAMTTDRPYRKGLPMEQAIEELQRGAGSQFDPDLIEPYISVLLEDPQALPTRRMLAGKAS